MSKTIGVVGTRRRNAGEDFLAVKKAFLKIYNRGDCICSGLCPKGADSFAVIIANKLNIPSNKRKWFPADWKKFGIAAGFLRNTDIAKNSDVLIACVAEDRKGGTEDSIRKFLKIHNKKRPLILV